MMELFIGKLALTMFIGANLQRVEIGLMNGHELIFRGLAFISQHNKHLFMIRHPPAGPPANSGLLKPALGELYFVALRHEHVIQRLAFRQIEWRLQVQRVPHISQLVQQTVQLAAVRVFPVHLRVQERERAKPVLAAQHVFHLSIGVAMGLNGYAHLFQAGA